MLVKQLPRDSALNRDLYGEAADWSVTDHLLAAAVDHLAAANWMFACVNTAEDGDQPDPPVPVPRPGDGSPPDEGPGEGEPETGAGPAGDRHEERSPSAGELVRFFA